MFNRNITRCCCHRPASLRATEFEPALLGQCILPISPSADERLPQMVAFTYHTYKNSVYNAISDPN